MIWVRCISLSLRSKTRQRATPLLPTWIHSCGSGVLKRVTYQWYYWPHKHTHDEVLFITLYNWVAGLSGDPTLVVFVSCHHNIPFHSPWCTPAANKTKHWICNKQSQVRVYAIISIGDCPEYRSVPKKKQSEVLQLLNVLFAVSGKVWYLLNWVNQASWIPIVTITDHTKSVSNRCVIEVLVASLCYLIL